MNRVTRTLLGAMAVAGLALTLSAPAQAAVGVYFGVGPSYGPAYGSPYPAYGPDDGYYDDGYADANACDYYTPPWGYPPDYCDYSLWNQPVYFGGAWFSGPIYYRNFSGINWFWLNGGWRRDEWRGPRPAHIDWNDFHNHRWSGQVFHGRENFAGGNRGFGGGNRNGANRFAGRTGSVGNHVNYQGGNSGNGHAGFSGHSFGSGAGGSGHAGFGGRSFSGGVGHSGGAHGGSFSHSGGNNHGGGGHGGHH